MKKDILDKAEELYSVMIDKLHRHLVIEKKEISVSTAVQLVQTLNALLVDKDKESKPENFILEEDILK